MSFSEVRSYQYGDEVRDIDWNVTARTGDPHIKVFEEERELTIMLLVDVSRSVLFGTGDQWKGSGLSDACSGKAATDPGQHWRRLRRNASVRRAGR